MTVCTFLLVFVPGQVLQGWEPWPSERRSGNSNDGAAWGAADTRTSEELSDPRPLTAAHGGPRSSPPVSMGSAGALASLLSCGRAPVALLSLEMCTSECTLS